MGRREWPNLIKKRKDSKKSKLWSEKPKGGGGEGGGSSRIDSLVVTFKLLSRDHSDQDNDDNDGYDGNDAGG